MQAPSFKTALPFKTDDAILAFCLYQAGVPEWRPPMNIYTAEMLAERGYKGWKLEEAAKAEHAKVERTRGREGRGAVEYWFESTPELPHLLKAYQDQQQIIKAEGNDTDAGKAIRDIQAKAAGRDPKTNDVITPMDEREAIVRMGCIMLKVRIAYVNRWKESPYLKIAKGGQPKMKKGGDGKYLDVQYPAFDLIPLFASDELKRNMKLRQ